MLRRFAVLSLLLAAAASIAFAQGKPIPQLVKKGDKFTFMVDGKPFIILGGQVNNDSAFSDRLEPAWPKFQAMNMNTIEYPVYWNEIEREEGRFDFRDFDQERAVENDQPRPDLPGILRPPQRRPPGPGRHLPSEADVLLKAGHRISLRRGVSL